MKKEPYIIGVVKHEHPASILWITQPATEQLVNVRPRIFVTRNLQLGNYITNAAVESRRAACVQPEHPRLWGLVSDLICVVDGNLSLPVDLSVLNVVESLVARTQPLRLQPGRLWQ